MAGIVADYFSLLATIGPLWALVVIAIGILHSLNDEAVREGKAGFQSVLAVLREPPLLPGYRELLIKFLDRVGHFIGDHDAQRPLAFSSQSFVFSLGLAAAYPLFFMALNWTLNGTGGQIGTITVFPEGIGFWQRAQDVGAFALVAMFVVYLVLWEKIDALDRRPLVKSAIFLTFYVLTFVAAAQGNVQAAIAWAGLGALLIHGSAAGAVVGSFAFTFTSAVVLARTTEYSFAPHVTAVASLFAAYFVYAACRLFDQRRVGWLLALVLAAASTVPSLVLSSYDGQWPSVDFTATPNAESVPAGALVLFLLLLPAANAPMDWLSLGVTRHLLRWIADGKAGYWATFGIVIVDILFALLMIVAVTAGTAALLAAFSKLHALGGGANLMDVQSYISGMREDPSGTQWWWIYAMLLSTLVPTIFNLVMLLIAFGLSPLPLGEALASYLERHRDHTYRRFFATVLLTGYLVVPLLAVILLLLFAGVLLVHLYPTALEALLTIAEMAASPFANWDGFPFPVPSQQ